MYAQDGSDDDSFEHFCHDKSVREVEIPVRLVELSGITKGQKIFRGCRSNHYLLCSALSDMTLVFFTNQRARKIVLRDLRNCRVVWQDSLAVQSMEIAMVNCAQCVFVFDQCDAGTLQCANVTDCAFQFTNEEGSLLDEHQFFFDDACRGNRIDKISIVPGTDPQRDPHLPLEDNKTVTLVADVRGPSVARFTLKGRGVSVVPLARSNVPDIAAEVESVRAASAQVCEKLSNDELGELYRLEVAEQRDSEADALRKVRHVAALLRAAEGRAVLFAGAGISTSASLKDYRGPDGAWTRLAGGKLYAGDGDDDNKLLSEAFPTYAHYCTVELLRRGILRHVVSTNMDGLFLRAGVPPAQLSELHGNCFREYCTQCGVIHLRKFDTLLSRTERWSHLTHRLCNACGGPLRDSIVHFTEHWTFPEEVYKGLDECYDARVAVAVGSSMIVQPAVSFPKKVLKRGGQLVLVNLQRTPVDALCTEKLYVPSDDFFALLMRELGIDHVPIGYDLLEHLPDDVVKEDETLIANQNKRAAAAVPLATATTAGDDTTAADASTKCIIA